MFVLSMAEIDEACRAPQARRMERIGLTQEIGAFACHSARMSIPPEAIAAAKRAVIDTVGVTLAGRKEPVVAIARGLLSDGKEAFDWTSDRWRPASDAALINGVAGHVLDYDDVAQAGHPSVVIVPAALAEAQRLGLSGKRMLEACVVGYEVWGELAGREPDAFHLGSWHPTSVLGIVAATAAVISLHHLTPEQATDALAVAASLASGVIANFGSHAKSLQAGRAAANAIEAVRFAAAGVSGSADAVEGPHGLLRGISPSGKVDTDSRARLGQDGWRVLTDGLSVKRYPVCYASHRAIDAVIALAERENMQPEQVRGVTVRLGQAPAETLRYSRPGNGLEARFSLHHNVAAALIDRAAGFAQLEDTFVARPDVVGLYGLTRMQVGGEPCDEQPGMAMHDQVTLELADGRTLDSGPLRYPRGHARQPLSEAELEEKFLDCARHGGVDDPERVLERLSKLDHTGNVRELTL